MAIVIDGTAGISGVDGSAGTPAVQGTDTNTGVFYPAADTVGVSTGGSERMRVDSSGNVGIGVTPSYRLEVKGPSATAGQLSIHDGTGDITVSGNNAASLLFQARDTSVRTIAEIDAVNTTTNGTGGAMVFQTRISDTLAERMRIDSSGNVGIGTATPTALRTVNLEVSSSATNDSAALIVNKRGTGIATARLATVGGANGFDINYNFPNSGMLSFYDLAANTTRLAIDSSGNFQFNSGYGSVATAYGCRAWVNFNGTGTVAIRASGNVSSITDNGTGDYTVNFTTAMPDANYNAVSMGQRNDFNNGDMNISFYGNVYGTAIGTGSVRVNSAHASSYTLSDALTVCVAIFR